MRKGVLLFAVIAFALTGGTIYFVNTWMKAERSRLAAAQQKKVEEPRESGVFVLVGSKDLPAGHIITVSDLRWQSWPDKSVPPQYVVKKDVGTTDIPPSYVGTVVRRAIVASGPITPDNLIKLGDRGFLAAVLKAGHRAIAVRIDESTGVAGLIYPGDRVDVILTHEVGVKQKEADRESESKVRVGETILSNVRVIAIDQSLEDLKTQKGAARSPKTATLEVTPQQAEIIAVAIRMGTLTLTLQSLACAGETQSASTGDGPNCSESTNALPEEPSRGKTYTADHDVSRMSRREHSNTAEVFVLRGTDKDNQKDNSVTVKLPPGSTTKQ